MVISYQGQVTVRVKIKVRVWRALVKLIPSSIYVTSIDNHMLHDEAV